MALLSWLNGDAFDTLRDKVNAVVDYLNLSDFSSTGIKTDNIFLKTKILEIGDWNMDTTVQKTVAHGLVIGKIRGVLVTIINDGGTDSYDLTYSNPPSLGNQGAPGGSIERASANIVLDRVTGNFFDSVSFDSTSYNRGWIVVTYEA